MSTPLLSVCLITYNQEDFISQAIEGVLMQKVNFSIELIIADDCSTDGTTDIIIKYQAKHPDFIKLIIQESNVGPAKNWKDLITSPNDKTKYIAYFEGDDYWTDPYKLQKQVDFLQNNNDFGICFHNVKELNTFDLSKTKLIPNVEDDVDFSIEDYILNNKTATCSIVFKKQCLGVLPKWFFKLPFGDLGIVLVVMKNSNKKARIFQDVMGVYRLHEKGIHGSLHENNKLLIKAFKQHIKFTNIIANKLLFEKAYKKHIIKKYINTYAALMNLNRQEKNITEYFKFKFLHKFYNLKYDK